MSSNLITYSITHKRFKEYIGFYIINVYQWEESTYKEEKLRQLYFIEKIIREKLRGQFIKNKIIERKKTHGENRK